MLALTSPYFWYTTRATGLVAMVLFTAVVTLGSLVANRVGGTSIGRFELNELHRSVSMVAVVFLVLHILTTVMDSFVSTGIVSAFIPMTSSYKRLPVALGAVAFDLILAVWISSLLKARIANQTWRFIHWFSWLGFATSIVHALLTGTDSRSGVGLLLVLACSLTALAAGLWRVLGRPARAAGRTALSPLAAAPASTRPAPRGRPFDQGSGRAPSAERGRALPQPPTRTSRSSERPTPPATERPNQPPGAFPRVPQSDARRRGRR
ncbi:MAG TPA: ferric reductase-like transmembrane domain-containing protein [Acidimicrobiales bacterium]|nr:ferric reductase-like transmembrane domain-containing protein [Acidimicrobiales bacterium]